MTNMVSSDSPSHLGFVYRYPPSHQPNRGRSERIRQSVLGLTFYNGLPTNRLVYDGLYSGQVTVCLSFPILYKP